LETGT